MSDESAVFLEGPPDTSGLFLTLVESGKTVQGVQIDLESCRKDYDNMSFDLFAKIYLQPAVAHLLRKAA